jgi:tyrosyl-tRNA synthetase
MDKIEQILTRGVVNIIPNKDKLKKLLLSGKRLNVYLGIDPTATRIHIGHAVPLRKLQEFIELGHNVTFLIGDFTALIGDTSDKDSERPVLTYEQIQENFKTYKNQASKILDFSKVKVRFNGEWLKKLDFVGVVKLCQHFSFGEFVSRELIRKRLDEGKKVGLHEALYPVMQGYDSYFMDTDIQIGGADQTFNMQAGRILQKHLRNKESFVLVTGYLEGIDGRKMSKSWGNAIWLEDSPDEMFGKVMSLADNLIIPYFTFATKVPQEKIEEIEKKIKSGENPLNAKKELAFTLVSELHSKAEAERAQEEFERTFQKRGVPSEIPTITINDSSLPLLDLIFATKAVASRSEAKRFILQGGIDVEESTINDPTQEITIPKEGIVIKVGKIKFVKVKSK